MTNLDNAKLKLNEAVKLINELQKGPYSKGTTEYESNLRTIKAKINEAFRLLD